MNRIRVSDKEMLDIIKANSVFESEAPDLLQHIYEHGFIFTEYTLIWENMYIYKVKIEGLLSEQVIYVKKIYKTKAGGHKHKNIEFSLYDFLDNISEFSIKYQNKTEYTKEMIDSTWSADYVPVISFMQYVLHEALNQEIIYKDKADRIYKSHPGKSNPNKELKLIDVIRRYAVHINHSTHHITCDHWIVKGHFRHYRNGKTTYIKPYSKGKNKNAAPIDRTYHL